MNSRYMPPLSHKTNLKYKQLFITYKNNISLKLNFFVITLFLNLILNMTASVTALCIVIKHKIEHFTVMFLWRKHITKVGSFCLTVLYMNIWNMFIIYCVHIVFSLLWKIWHIRMRSQNPSLWVYHIQCYNFYLQD